MVLAKRLLPLCFLALAACTPELPACCGTPEPPPAASQDGAAQLWTADTRTILTGDAARALASQCSRPSPGPVESTWSPSEADVAAIEDELLLRVARELEQRGESPSPGGYYRQYAGFVIGGRRIIYVNEVDEQAIDRSGSSFDWRTQPVRICDGGPITFGAEYDPATHRFSNFAFNGQL